MAFGGVKVSAEAHDRYLAFLCPCFSKTSDHTWLSLWHPVFLPRGCDVRVRCLPSAQTVRFQLPERLSDSVSPSLDPGLREIGRGKKETLTLPSRPLPSSIFATVPSSIFHWSHWSHWAWRHWVLPKAWSRTKSVATKFTHHGRGKKGGMEVEVLGQGRSMVIQHGWSKELRLQKLRLGILGVSQMFAARSRIWAPSSFPPTTCCCHVLLFSTLLAFRSGDDLCRLALSDSEGNGLLLTSIGSLSSVRRFQLFCHPRWLIQAALTLDSVEPFAALYRSVCCLV